jgi:ABC-2 type transport system permease protein
MRTIVEMCRRTWTKTFRRPVLLSFSFVQPLLWLVLFGFLFQGVRARYLDYLAPGICAMTVLFGASQSGIGWIRDLQTGFLARMLRTDASPSLILFGKLLADSLRLLAQAAIVLLLAFALGARVSIDWFNLPHGLICLFLFALGFSSLSSFVALRTGAQEAMATYVHLVNMPLLFTSSALMPRDRMPDWLAAVGRYNPLTLAVDAWRGAVLLHERPRPLESILILSVVAAVLFLLALSAMGRHGLHRNRSAQVRRPRTSHANNRRT